MASTLFNTPATHYERALVRSPIVLSGCGAFFIAFVVWVWLTIDTSLLRVSFTGEIFVLQSSAFVAGNTFRLRDVRTRKGNELRNRPNPDSDETRAERAKLPPRATIQFRFRVAGLGSTLGSVALILTSLIPTLFESGEQSAGQLWVTTLLGGVCGGLTFIAGTYTQPLD